MNRRLNMTTRRGSCVNVKACGGGEVRLQISHPDSPGSMRAALDEAQQWELAQFLLASLGKDEQ